MIRIRVRELAFALSFGISLRLWAICSQLVLLFLYFFILLILLRETGGRDSDVDGFLRGSPDQQSREDAASQKARKSISKVAGSSQVLRNDRSIPSRPALGHLPQLERTRKEFDAKNLGQNCSHQHSTPLLKLASQRLPEASHTTGTNRWEERLQAAKHKRISHTEVFPHRSAQRTARRIPLQVAFMTRSKRDAVLARLRDVVHGEPQQDDLSVQRAEPKTLPPATFGLSLPLSTRLLASHLKTSGGDDRNSQYLFDPSACSPSSISFASVEDAQVRTRVTPTKRNIAANDPDALPRVVKVLKMEEATLLHENEAPPMHSIPGLRHSLSISNNDETAHMLSPSSTVFNGLLFSHDTSHSSTTDYDEEMSLAPSCIFRPKRPLSDHGEETIGPVLNQLHPQIEQLDETSNQRIMRLVARLNK